MDTIGVDMETAAQRGERISQSASEDRRQLQEWLRTHSFFS